MFMTMTIFAQCNHFTVSIFPWLFPFFVTDMMDVERFIFGATILACKIIPLHDFQTFFLPSLVSE